MVSEDKAVDIKKEEQSNSTINSAQDVQNKHHEADEVKDNIIRLKNNEAEDKTINSKEQEDNKVDLDKKLSGNDLTIDDNLNRQNESKAPSAEDIPLSVETIDEEKCEVATETLNNAGEILSNKFLLGVPNLDVPFSERRLAPETINLLNKPIDKKLTMPAIEFQLSKIIALILKSRGLHYSEDFLSQMNDLSTIYFHDIIETLRKFTEIQRRKKASISDTELCFRMKGIKPEKLYKEYEETKVIAKKFKSEIELINKQTRSLINLSKEDSEFDENDPSLPFFTNEHYEITELIPKQSSKPIYIPFYLPELPPDYTYQKTPKYMDMITDLKQLRLKLVDESRLTERSLYNLIDDDEKKWKEDFEKQIRDTLLEIDEDTDSENENSLMSEVDHKNQTDIETPIPDHNLEGLKSKLQPTEWNTRDSISGEIDGTSEVLQNNLEGNLPHTDKEQHMPPPYMKAFDFVEYAQKRHELQHAKDLEIDRKRKLRESNIFFKAEKYYSPYATVPVTHEVDVYFANIVQDEFKSVIRSVRTAEKKKKRKVEKILCEKAEREQAKEREREKMGLGFSFGPISHILDDDNDDSDNDEDMGFPTFDFGDNNVSQDEKEIDVNPINNVTSDNNETGVISGTKTDRSSAAYVNTNDEMDSDSFEAELEDAIQVESAPKESLLENNMNTNMDNTNDIPSESSDDEVEVEDV